jgi:5-methylcytosine-specific restriction endonuclease McrA
MIIRERNKICGACKSKVSVLLPFHHAPYNEEWNDVYCLGCIWALEKDYDIPGMERLKYCAGCRSVLPFKLLKNHKKLETGGWGYCESCFEREVDKNSIICIICEQKTLDYTWQSRGKSMCKDCYIKPPLWQAVAAQNHRAKAKNLPATLTDEQWDQALSYFENKCAYCIAEPYQVLEHFVPINKGGGTTADNCIPSCNMCNSKKGHRHPSNISHLFPSENLARIREYLSQQSA